MVQTEREDRSRCYGVLQVSPKRFGNAPTRTQRLDVAVSVLRLEETDFILSMRFSADQQVPPADELSNER